MPKKLLQFERLCQGKRPLTAAGRGHLSTDKSELPIELAVSKAEIYEALYSLNAGIQQFLISVDFLDRAGLGLPLLNGYRILADQIRSAINFSATEVMTAIELRDYGALEKSRAELNLRNIRLSQDS